MAIEINMQNIKVGGNARVFNNASIKGNTDAKIDFGKFQDGFFFRGIAPKSRKHGSKFGRISEYSANSSSPGKG